MAENRRIERESARVYRATFGLLGVVVALSVFAFAAPATRASAAETTALSVAATSTSETTPTTEPTPTPTGRREIGRSVLGRPIFIETFGSGARHILIVGGIHGNEYGGPVTRKFAAYLRANPSVIPSGTQVDVIAYANPDGTARGRRGNAHNVDINRNFPARNWNTKRNASGTTPGAFPGSEPETQVLLSVLASGTYVRVLSMHSQGGILDYDGPGGWTTAKRMSRASRVPVHRLGAYHGSMGSYIPETYGRPIVTWELSSRALTKRVRAGMVAAIK